MIPLVDLKAQYAANREQIDVAIQRVLDNANFILGDEVRDFEACFAAYSGAAHAVGLSSGTAALELALRALGVGAGDEVITVAHTFIATAEAISAVGATPIFVDIDPRTANMDAAAAASAVTPRTAALMPVHLYGQPADMDALCALAEGRHLALIEDAAQAHGARWQGKRVGALGDVGCFSFYPGKNLGAYGDAGAAVTDNAVLADKIRLLRNHGRKEKYTHEVAGFGERLDTLQAAVLLAKLPSLPAWTRARQDIAAYYTAALADGGLLLPWVDPRAEAVWHLYVIRTPQRDALQEWLRAHGVESGIHYPLPLHLQPAYAALGYHHGDLPACEQFAAECLSLPIYPEMTRAQQEHVVELVLAFQDGPQ